MDTVFIWPNIGKKNIREAITECCTLLQSMGATVLLPEESKAFAPNLHQVRFTMLEQGVAACDFIISLGGDGTILRIAEMAARYEKPLIGVNLGHVGFMTELEYSELSKIEKIFAGKYSIDSRMMLELRVIRDGVTLLSQTALNDVIVYRGNPFRVIEVNIRADGVPVSAFLGDGVIIATPTGTTAYSLSAGGPIVEPSAENIAVTPVCAHNLQAKSFVFAPERVISITAAGPDNTSVCVSADGRNGMELLPHDQVLIQKSKMATKLIRVKGKSFYHILKTKLGDGGNAP